MVSLITQGIKISISTGFEGTYFKNQKLNFAFSYQITIENHGKETVQLVTRHWEIKDALNDLEVVDGEGVVGNKPILKPGESHVYSSGCMLSSPFGAMSGHFNMINHTTTHNFRVAIPSFKLSARFAMN